MTGRLRAALTGAVSTALLGAALIAAPAASADALDDGQWWRSAMGVDELNRVGTGKGITVAVIDSPIDSSVPELKGRVASSTTECLAPGGGRQKSTSQDASASHATSMAALIVGSGKGTTPGGRGISGIAPEATLRHYAVLFPLVNSSKPRGCGLRDPSIDNASEATARAIQQATKDGAKVISISLTVSYDERLVEALLDAYRAGVIVVAATSNERREAYWPAAANGVVTVTHVDQNGNLDNSASRNEATTDFTAPGARIAAGAWTPSGWRSDVISDGSSQATAITAGGLAAVWSAHPRATGNQVLQAAKDAIGMRAKNGKYFTWFRRVGENLPKATGKTQSYGFGIFSPADAVKLDVESLPDKNPTIAERGVSLPSAEDIAAATGSASATSSASASPTAPATGATEADAAEGAESEAGPSLLAWALAVLVLAAVVAGFLVWRRQGSRHDSHEVQVVQHERHDRTDTSAPADGAGATTKEHSHGAH